MARAHDEAQRDRLAIYRRLFAKSEFGPASDLTIGTFAQRPDLMRKVFGPEIQSAMPEFMRHDPKGGLYYRDEAFVTDVDR